MENHKIISALCYASLLFAPFLLPLIVYFVIKDKEVKYHARRAFVSHSIPTALSILLAIFGFIGMLTLDYNNMSGYVILMFVLMGIYFLVTIGIIIWNIIQAYRIYRVGF
ncbi:DUF4870 domain-containing protein [Ureibacillus aquaedulcis]|uniref:DUF4870 domain-containing protein n=1 Tax=Ureibacillus aquaedulcis TaxID=3058421 RepID=A0ABT8GVX9_9BACL|nr:DUF4870 domain-containing protein [Ureibacillus sp. BA0131]MDN4495056.1 DUF4870 domain-containing protein [Ureibacillus sp. BA0131]